MITRSRFVKKARLAILGTSPEITSKSFWAILTAAQTDEVRIAAFGPIMIHWIGRVERRPAYVHVPHGSVDLFLNYFRFRGRPQTICDPSYEGNAMVAERVAIDKELQENQDAHEYTCVNVHAAVTAQIYSDKIAGD